MPEQHSSRTERRPVRSDDPSLSTEANKLLTQELREAIGSDEVVVPAGQPDRARDAHATKSTGAATLASNRPLIIVTFLGALVVGGIIALVTGQYWAVLVAAALHAIGTLAVAGGALHLSTQAQHGKPTLAARPGGGGRADRRGAPGGGGRRRPRPRPQRTCAGLCGPPRGARHERRARPEAGRRFGLGGRGAGVVDRRRAVGAQHRHRADRGRRHVGAAGD